MLRDFSAASVAVLAATAATASLARPSSAQIAVLSETIDQRAALPGQTYQGRLLVHNAGKDAQEVRIYQTDYKFTADGRADYADPGSLSRSNAKWIQVNPTYVTVPADATIPVTYTVAVPTDTSLKGTYWSLIMVEGIVPGSPESRKPNARVQVGLSVVTRYATQVATDIGATGESRLAFDSLKVTGSDSSARRLRYDFINTGERAHRFVMSLELYNEAGELVKKASQTRGLLYPGTAARQEFDLGTIPHGDYTAVLVADGGGDHVFGGQFKVSY